MTSERTRQIAAAVRQDEARLRAIESLPEETQMQYAPGIAKLRRRIYEERAAIGTTPDDTEAWAKWLLDDFPYHEHPESMRQTINRHLEEVERTREACDVDTMQATQRRLEQILEEALRPTQLRLDDTEAAAGLPGGGLKSLWG